MDWVLVIFTMMNANVEPVFQEVPVPSQSACVALRDRLLPKFETTEGLVFTLKCESRDRKEKSK